MHYNIALNDAARLALVSLTSTANSNITVGPPFELSTYQADQFQLSGRCHFEDSGDYLKQIEASWREGLQQAFENLPRFDWEVAQEQDLDSHFSECEMYQ